MMSQGTSNTGFVPVDAVYSGSGNAYTRLTAGERLREARTKLGLTLDSAAARTRIRRDYLEALETMDPRGLPAQAYAIGYLRTYARFLALDDVALVDQFKGEADTQTGRATPTAPQQQREIKLPRGLIGVVLILLLVALVAWWYSNAISGETVFDDIPPPPDDVMSQNGGNDIFAADLPQVASADIWSGLPSLNPTDDEIPDITLRASAPVFLEVRDSAGRILFSRELGVNETYRPISEPGLTITAEDGGRIMVEVDGEETRPLGDPGQSVTDAPLFAAESVDPA
ncbi:helix-turn-helix domain-containing protein [Hyphobacterium sp. CCMP332]|uniref:helix-turn-helix domain-containing protein n=1 Tax=Hyphobacterium sp. CCMP332 TaxID=2749086 RepID=UPI00164F09ED|nr:helix-turn-helix domain-containing protein [Hyphobacterium sp. CCMP332]QNL18071.1 helix-turn-helix domain-containing protein [Hyphobacterium sp. CCMP332]